jgi:hypothetical protein
VGPFAEIRKERDDINLVFFQELNWATLKLVDCIFLQRPCTKNHLIIAELTKRNNVPLWVDFDDDLFAVPPWNPCSHIYNKEDVQQNIAQIAAMADVISVSTQALKDRLNMLNPTIKVVPNAFDLRTIGNRPLYDTQEKPGKLILWRGSKTHRLDLNVAANACIEISREHPELSWFFLGDKPWFVDFMPSKSVTCAEAIDPIEYFELIAKVRAEVMLVPLADCAFNRAKSNIAWIEASWCYSATLAPNWPEWQKPGIANYTTEADFKSSLQYLIWGNQHEVYAQQSWDYIESNLLLSNVNKLRISIMEGLGLWKN